MKRTLTLLLLLIIFGIPAAHSQCGLDIYVANDQSGSVDAVENAQSRDFITRLAQLRTLGNANTQNRIAIADWAETNTFTMFNFPGVGRNYTTNMSDVLAYKNAARTLNGGTDPYQALQKSYQNLTKTPVTGRNVGKVLILMTDASANQVQSSIVSLASTIKATGVTIIVMAVGPAASVTTLQGSKVASDASLYFSAADYQTLVTNAVNTVGGMLSNACGQSTPTYDLAVKLNTANCGTGNVSYTVTNPWRATFNGTLSVSFYDGNPALPTSHLLTTDRRTGRIINIGASQTFSFTDPTLMNKLKLWAVVNLDTTGSKGIPPLPTDLSGRLFLTAEQNPFNNVSDSILAGGCSILTPRLEVNTEMVSISCDKNVTYKLNICNTGSVNADDIRAQLVPASNNFVLKSADGPVTTTGVASFTDPNTNTATSGYHVYGTSTFPCQSHATGDGCASTYSFTPAAGYFGAYAGFSFPPTSPGSGVPAGATILNATLTARVDTANASFVTSLIYGAKVTDAGAFNSTNRSVAYYLEHYRTTVSVPPAPNSSPINVVPVDVTAIAQELVNQPGWTSSSAMAFLWQGMRKAFTASLTSPANLPTLTVTYTGGSIPPGKCATYTYVYDASTAPAGTYNMSANVSSATAGVTYLPDVNFTTNGNSGLNGYNGALYQDDNAIIPANTGCAQTPQPITTSVSINPNSICSGPGNYVTATVTINNPNTLPAPGITLKNLIETLNFGGGDASFSGEPYDITNGLLLATPNAADTIYPAVNYAITGKGGAQALYIQELPAGTSTFKVDLVPGGSNFNLTSTISQIPTIYNAEGGASGRDANGVTVLAPPTVSWTCPGTIVNGNTINLSATVTGASTVTITSATAGTIPNTGTVAAPAATYVPTAQDIANGYADITVYAETAAGCDAGYPCKVPISGVVYDYGDAPASYDLGANVVSTAAGSTLRTGLYLGNIAPDTEPTAQPNATATGDGVEDDGLVSVQPIFSGTTATYQVRVTNNTGSPAYLTGFADFNGDGTLIDSNEWSAIRTIPANSGTAVYNVVFNDVPATGITSYFMRLRLTTSQAAAAAPYGPSPEGEIEDYQLNFTFPLPVHLESFKVTAQKCIVTTEWKIADIADIADFEVERSIDGRQFRKVGSVAVSADKSVYSLNDMPGGANWYYRLKINDKTGIASFSTVSSVTVACEQTGILVYPTTTENHVQVLLPSTYEQATITVFNNMGRPVALAVTGNGTNRQLQMSGLPTGLYMVQVKLGVNVYNFRVVRL